MRAGELGHDRLCIRVHIHELRERKREEEELLPQTNPIH